LSGYFFSKKSDKGKGYQGLNLTFSLKPFI